MDRIAFFPGTFDPMTVGHMDIINRALPMFDKIIVGIGRNSTKSPMYSEIQRLQWIRAAYKNEPKIQVKIYDGMTVTACKAVWASFILRGIRFVSDFEYEKMIADVNRSQSGIETVFLTCLPEHSSVASTIVRELIKNGGDVSKLLPEVILKDIK